MEEDNLQPRSRKRWVTYGALGVAVLVPLAVGIAWMQRKPIAADLIGGELAKRGVRATYDITAVGTRLQRIENIVVGDPANPDLTARWAEVDTSIGLFGAKVRAVRASGVRLKGRLVGNQLKLGDVDKLLPAPTGEPFSLPDIDIALADARMRLDSDYGPIGARFDGNGNPAGVFKGKLALVAPQVARNDCTGKGMTAYVDLATAGRKIAVNGPVRAARISCSGSNAQDVTLALDATLSERFDSWTGAGDIKAARVAMPGTTLLNPVLKADFAGDIETTSGKMNLQLASAAFSGGRAEQAEIGGTFQLGLASPDGPTVSAEGTVKAASIRPDGTALNQITQFGRAGAGTPAAPIIASLQAATQRLQSGSTGKARFTLNHERRDGQIRLNAIETQSVSGARLIFSGADPVRYAWREGGLIIGGLARLSGGGFPASDVQLSGADGRWSGRARIAPLVSGDTRIALSPVTFAFGRGGTLLETRATIDGRMGTTRFAGLQLPVSLRPGTNLISGCQSLAFDALAAGDLQLGPTRLQTCLTGAEARITAPRVDGRYGDWRFTAAGNSARYNLSSGMAWVDGVSVTGRTGSTPFALDARSARYGGAKGDFALQTVAAQIGAAGNRTVIDLGDLAGVVSGSTAQGAFSGASGRIGAVPLNMTEGQGNWRFGSGVLTLGGRLSVADQLAEARFQPLVSKDFTFRLADGRITAQGQLTEPETGAQVSNIHIAHDLSRGTGRAVLDVPQLRFGRTLQPEQLTRITLGVVANVEGSIGGRGEIRWSPGGVTSDGRFRTEGQGLNLAAAFGPVRGLSGEIVFTDLLGLETAPGQSLKIAEVNSGVQVIDGLVRYRLLPGLKAEVEGGRWPFSGGELILEPTVLDLSETAVRRLTFRVVGLDAAKFVNQLQLENIAATGTFDGMLPMVFTQTGGSIEAGHLVVREGGGTLSYIGEVSKENLGPWGLIAFDALKSMRYQKLKIDIAGPLDGEMVSRVRFSGVNQAEVVPGREQFKLPIPIKVVGLTGIPFIFNIEIRAPFRGLVTMARTFQDPSGLIQQQIDQDKRMRDQQQNKTNADKPVQ